MGQDSLLRRSFLSIEKFLKATCSPIKTQLGLQINTRLMIVSLPEDKGSCLKNTVYGSWHTSRKSFTLLEGVTLLGHLEHAAQVCP